MNGLTPCHNKFRIWLEIHVNAPLDILLQAKSNFGLNIVDISTVSMKILRKKLKTSKCFGIQAMYNDTSTKEVLKDLRDAKVQNCLTNFKSFSKYRYQINVERSICRQC